MNRKNLMLFFASLAIILLSCGKDKDVEDPHNHSLLTKTLPQIQAEIAGRWQMKRSHFFVCGSISCITQDTIYKNNDGDILSFLANDTVKQVNYTGYPTIIYEKADVFKYYTNGYLPVDSAYEYNMSNGYYIYIMQEIKNDSLVIFSGPTTYYLTRKP